MRVISSQTLCVERQASEEGKDRSFGLTHTDRRRALTEELWSGGTAWIGESL
jgi:hypothetical protein